MSGTVRLGNVFVTVGTNAAFIENLLKVKDHTVMQTSILWTGMEYHSLENCEINDTNSGVEIKSVVIGTHDRKNFKLDYFLKLNSSWETLFFELKIQLGKWLQVLAYEGDGSGNWYSDGNAIPDFKGCVDIDIAVSPLTNTIPIRRLELGNGDVAKIKVLYVDIFHHSISPVEQNYTRLSDSTYRYANVPPNFEANIEVDRSGFVVDYPPLFVRSEMKDTVNR